MDTNAKTCNRNAGNGAVDGKFTASPIGESTSVVTTAVRESSRTPFTDRNQVDADLALARTLQDQETAYMMLIRPNEREGGNGMEDGDHENDDDLFDDHAQNGHETSRMGTFEIEHADFLEAYARAYMTMRMSNELSGCNGLEEGDHEIEEESFDDHAHYDYGTTRMGTVEIDPADYPDDEAYARALQYAEEEELAYRFQVMAGINNSQLQVEEVDGHPIDAEEQDRWADVDPDELTYEDLLALGDVIGNASKGLSSTQISSLPSSTYKSESNRDGSNDLCVICQMEYEEDDSLTVLSCKHSYHFGCLANWLRLKKVCPVCNTEVSASDNP